MLIVFWISILSLHELTEHADCVIPIENKALYDIVTHAEVDFLVQFIIFYLNYFIFIFKNVSAKSVEKGKKVNDITSAIRYS